METILETLDDVGTSFFAVVVLKCTIFLKNKFVLRVEELIVHPFQPPMFFLMEFMDKQN